MTDETPAPEPRAEGLKPTPEQLERSQRTTRHGHRSRLNGGGYSPTYTSWQCMLARCRYPERDTERKYANRGIVVDPCWQSFDVFLADMGERPAGTTLDRRENDEGYSKDNCRWATPREQARNRRNKRLSLESATEVALRRLRGEPSKVIAADFGISESLPREIVRGRCWQDALAQAKALLSGDAQ